MFVDTGVPDPASVVVTAISQFKKFTVECDFERLNVYKRHMFKQALYVMGSGLRVGRGAANLGCSRLFRRLLCS